MERLKRPEKPRKFAQAGSGENGELLFLTEGSKNRKTFFDFFQDNVNFWSLWLEKYTSTFIYSIKIHEEIKVLSKL